MWTSPYELNFYVKLSMLQNLSWGPCDWDNAPNKLQVQPQTQWAIVKNSQNLVGGDPLPMFSPTTFSCIHCTQTPETLFEVGKGRRSWCSKFKPQTRNITKGVITRQSLEQHI